MAKILVKDKKELIKQVKARDIEKVKELIEKGVDPNEEVGGTNAYTHAINAYDWDKSEKSLEILQYLTPFINSWGYDDNPYNSYISGLYAASYAIAEKDETTKMLIDLGYNIKNDPAVYFYIGLMSFPLAKQVMEICGPDDGVSFYSAAAHGNRELIDYLLEMGIPVNKEVSDLRRPQDKYFAIHSILSIYPEDAELFIKMLDLGADPNQKGNWGMTCADLASQYYLKDKVHPDIKALLFTEKKKNPNKALIDGLKKEQTDADDIDGFIADGADLNKADIEGKTPIFYSLKSLKTTSKLVEKGADVNVTDQNGRTPLFFVDEDYHVIVRNNKEGVSGLLVNNGADINHTDNNGQTALLYQTTLEKVKEASLIALINAGTDLNIGDNEGKTFMHYLALANLGMFENERIIPLAIEKGAKLDILDKNGKAPLHYAIINEDDFSEDFYNYMLENKADVNIQSADGNTLLHYITDFKDNGWQCLSIIGDGADPQIKNKKGETAEELIKTKLFTNDDVNVKEDIEEAIEKAKQRSGAPQVLPQFKWEGVNVPKQQPKASGDPQIRGTIKLDHRAKYLYYIGDNLAVARGDVPEQLTCIDLETGDILWTLTSDTFAYRWLEDGILYFGSRVNGSSKYLAVDVKNGKVKWESGFGSTYHAWKGSGAYNMGDNLVFTTNSALVALDKKKGKKVYKTKLADYNLSVVPIMWNNQMIIQGSKKKAVFYHYNLQTGELIQTTAVNKGMEETYQKKREYIMEDDVCWYISYDGFLCNINFATGEYNEYKIPEPGKLLKHVNEYKLSLKNGKFTILMRYFYQDVDYYKIEFDTKTARFENEKTYAFDSEINEEWEGYSSDSDSFNIKEELTVGDKTVKLPDFKGDSRIWHAITLYNNVKLALQAGGRTYGEDVSLLHIIY